jgi:hypothetical protein
MSSLYESRNVNPNTTSYVMLDKYCNPNAGLGCGSAAPVYAPYNVNQNNQNIPSFGIDYNQAPYKSNLLYRCGACNGSYCKVNNAYGVGDKDGNPLPSSDCVKYISRGVNQQISNTGNNLKIMK